MIPNFSAHFFSSFCQLNTKKNSIWNFCLFCFFYFLLPSGRKSWLTRHDGQKWPIEGRRMRVGAAPHFQEFESRINSESITIAIETTCEIRPILPSPLRLPACLPPSLFPTHFQESDLPLYKMATERNRCCPLHRPSPAAALRLNSEKKPAAEIN